MIKGVAFDMEGTVVNVEPAHHGAWIRAAEEIGVVLANPQEATQKIPNFIGGPDDAIIEQIFALQSEIRPTLVKDKGVFLNRKWQHYDTLIKTMDLRPRKGFCEVYGMLRCTGIPVTIGTAVDLDKGMVLLRRSGLDRLFSLQEIVMITDVSRTKPAPDCFLETARRMRIGPNTQLVFEDSPRGVKSGVAAGSVVIGMPTYDNPIVKQKLNDAGAREIYLNWEAIDIDQLLRKF
ncbi:MAG: HAD family phosphatase [bacterium]|nr:HAD family phosphatase [bacterium]